MAGKAVRRGTGKANPIQSYQEASNQLLSINAQRKGNLAEAKSAEMIEAARNNTLAQAAEFVSSSPARGNEPVNATFNPATNNILGQYGLGQPKIQKNSSSSQQVTKQNIVINNRNTTITNNNVHVPAGIGGPVQSRPIQFQDPSQIKFKNWLSNSFAQQNELAEKRKREYDKRDAALTKNANKLMRKLEDTGKSIATSLNPKNMASSMGKQFKTLMLVMGFGYLAKKWPEVLNKVTKIQDWVGNIKDKITGFFENQGGRMAELLGGEQGETFFQSLRGLLLDEEDGLYGYIKLLLKNKAEERSFAISQIPKPDFNTGGLNLVGAFSKMISGTLTYLGSILQAIIDPKAAMKGQLASNIKNENYQNVENYYYNNHNKLDSKRTYVEDSQGRVVGNVSYQDVAGGLFKPNGYKGLLPGSLDKNDKLILTPQLEGELSQAVDLARNIKAASSEGGNQVNTSNVAAGLRRLNIKAHESGSVYLDDSSIRAFGVTPEEIGAKKVTGRYIVVPRAQELRNAEEYANLKDMGGYTYSTEAGIDFAGTNLLTKLTAPISFTSGALANEIVQGMADSQTDDYQTIMVDEADLENVLSVLKARNKPFKVLDNKQEIYKLSEEQMRFLTQQLGVKLSEPDNIESDLNLGNTNYLSAINDFLESKIDQAYRNSEAYQKYEKYAKFDQSKIVENTRQNAINQLAELRGIEKPKNIAGALPSKEYSELSNMSLEELYSNLNEESRKINERINPPDDPFAYETWTGPQLNEGETLADLYNRQSEIQSLLDEITKYYTYTQKSRIGEGVKYDDETGNVIIEDGGKFELKNTFQPLPEPERPTVRRDRYTSFLEGMEAFDKMSEQHSAEQKRYLNNSRMGRAWSSTTEAAGNAWNNVSNWVSSTFNPDAIKSGDLSGVIAASKTGYFYSDSSDNEGVGESGSMSRKGHGYIQLGTGKYKGKCTSGPRTFYKDGLGIDINPYYWKEGSYHHSSGSNLDKIGFKKVWWGTKEQGRNVESVEATGFKLEPGDIMLNFAKGLAVTKSHPEGQSGHAQMWNGEQWVSDTYQGSRSWPYSDTKNPNNTGRLGNESCQIWRFDKDAYAALHGGKEATPPTEEEKQSNTGTSTGAESQEEITETGEELASTFDIEDDNSSGIGPVVNPSTPNASEGSEYAKGLFYPTNTFQPASSGSVNGSGAGNVTASVTPSSITPTSDVSTDHPAAFANNGDAGGLGSEFTVNKDLVTPNYHVDFAQVNSNLGMLQELFGINTKVLEQNVNATNGISSAMASLGTRGQQPAMCSSSMTDEYAVGRSSLAQT